MASTLIKNGLVYDGLGNAPKKADIYIKDDRIERIGETICREADLVVDIAKMKSHCMTMLSGAVKNLFGTVPGLMI